MRNSIYICQEYLQVFWRYFFIHLTRQIVSPSCRTVQTRACYRNPRQFHSGLHFWVSFDKTTALFLSSFSFFFFLSFSFLCFFPIFSRPAAIGSRRLTCFCFRDENSRFESRKCMVFDWFLVSLSYTFMDWHGAT